MSLLWWREDPDEALKEARDEALTTVEDHRANFEDAMQRAEATGSTTRLNVDTVRQGFEHLKTAIATAGVDDLETLTDSAERLERLRAYVYPGDEVAIEGRSALADLEQWGIPAPIVGALRRDVEKLLTDSNVNVARGALRSLFGAYDYWAWYVDWYAGFMERVAWWLLGLEAVALVLALSRLLYGDVILGVILASVCGALGSVISKMPPMMADAESDAYVRRIVMRVGTGVIAGVIGGGLLASGIVTVSLPGGSPTLKDIVEQCGKDVRDAQPGAATPAVLAKAGTGLPAAVARPRCSTSAFLLLLAIGLLLGFSERALTSFEDRIFPEGKKAQP